MFVIWLLRLLLPIAIGVFLFLWFHKPSRYRVRSTKKNDLQVKTLHNRKTFHKALMSLDYTTNVPKWVDLVSVEKESTKNGDRVVGAFIYMRKPLLQRNKQLIKDKIVQRDATLRKHARVPGRPMVRSEAVTVGGQRMALWHITHMLPYRYCLSDGEIPDIMFMGTAHLNMGARYDKGYVPAQKGTFDSVSARVNHLKEAVNAKRKTKYGLQLKTPLITGLPREYGKVQYSMDDFERLADYIINSRKDDEFKYGVECFYRGDNVIPESVQIYMINMTRKRQEFRVTLKNRK